MFGNLFGDIERQQQEIKAKLADISVQGSSGDGAVIVTATAARRITNIKLDYQMLDIQDKEMVEDLVLEAINRALEQAEAEEGQHMQQALDRMMPGGVGGLSDLVK